MAIFVAVAVWACVRGVCAWVQGVYARVGQEPEAIDEAGPIDRP